MRAEAAYASRPDRSRGRHHPEPERPGPRDCWQRDRDRIVHSIAFRRLRHKTQVFMAPDGDHFRVRLTHSLEVAQIGRSVARALGLNEDLTEALCLAHDIGHPPFGHAGEDALREALGHQGGFDHNAHTLRALTRIETPYPFFDGLNLTWETLEGLAKHNGPIADANWALAEIDAAFPLDLGSQPSLEAQVAAIADDIAYDNHDIDDGIRAGLLDPDRLRAAPLIGESWARAERDCLGCPPERLRAEVVRAQIGWMVGDLIDETRRRIAAAGVASVNDVRAHAEPLAGFSPELRERERALKAFMYAELYHHPTQIATATLARAVIAALFAAYRADPHALPERWRAALPADEPHRSRHIADFVAGMTDRYAIARHRELIGPVDLPEAF